MKPEIKYEAGKIIVDMSGGLDKDGDGKMSIEGELKLKLSLYEIMNEVSKKDMPALELILAELKIGKQ